MKGNQNSTYYHLLVPQVMPHTVNTIWLIGAERAHATTVDKKASSPLIVDRRHLEK
jgi:hypothetical protein